jgi:uncharacterized protein (DUF2267 family)
MRNRVTSWLGCVATATCLAVAVLLPPGVCIANQPAEERADFVQDVAPLLVSRCLGCHSGDTPEGGLRVHDAAALAAGGDSGPALVPGQVQESLLWQRVSAGEMPPDEPLTAAEQGTIAAWLAAGGGWVGEPLDLFAVTTDERAGRDWWSLQPLVAASVPEEQTIDTFVQERLAATGLRPAAEATPRVLLRRLFFDLIGLPPTPEQIAAFEADPSDEAYRRHVDALLASPAYGERWGRHWLDVVRYGESDGFERNFQREHAWPYRDWVIRSLNDDMPYHEFVRRQLIGDQLEGGLEGAAAAGFWVAGVHNTVVGGSERMKKLARQDEIEEVLGTVGQTFVGLTFNCARCHDHKFDPISQREYYQLASAISGLGHGERTIDLPDEQRALTKLEAQLGTLRDSLATFDAAARERVLASRNDAPAARPLPPQAIARWEFEDSFRDSIGALHGTAVGNARLDGGGLLLDGASYVTTPPLTRPLHEKTLEAWIQLDSLDQAGGGVISVETLDGLTFDAIVFGEREPRRWMIGSNNFSRSLSFDGIEELEATNRPVHVAIVFHADGVIECFRDGVPYGQPTKPGPAQTYEPEASEVLFGLRHRPEGGNRFLTGRILEAALYDRALDADEVARAVASGTDHVSEAELIAVLTAPEQESRSLLKAAIADCEAARNELASKATMKVYTLSPGAGDLVPLLARGDPEQPGDVVAPAAPAAIPSLSGDFHLTPDAPEATRREKLAEWVVNDSNPLFARVIVNRIWHHHFGTGLVDTPSDFGFNGGRPSHPDLLDALAVQFREHGQSLKWLHRAIVTSATYRQSSSPSATDPRGPEIDAGNRLLWKGPVRRLEAEAIRDSMLAVAGVLKPHAGGPGFRDVSITLNNGTTYYEPLDVDDEAFFYRTVYRFSPRGDRPALLEAFDCPDPSSTAPKRSVTTTPLQSLSLLNSGFVLRLAERFAESVEAEAGSDVAAQVDAAWRRAVGRLPTGEERALSEPLVDRHGLAALCRGLLNTTEFVLID